MATADLRNKVQEYIHTADERLLKMIKALVETYQGEEHDSTLSEEHYKKIDERRDQHKKGKTESFTWKEVKENARSLKGS
jgi:hypothetical protein